VSARDVGRVGSGRHGVETTAASPFPATQAVLCAPEQEWMDTEMDLACAGIGAYDSRFLALVVRDDSVWEISWKSTSTR